MSNYNHYGIILVPTHVLKTIRKLSYLGMVGFMPPIYGNQLDCLLLSDCHEACCHDNLYIYIYIDYVTHLIYIMDSINLNRKSELWLSIIKIMSPLSLSPFLLVFTQAHCK